MKNKHIIILSIVFVTTLLFFLFKDYKKNNVSAEIEDKIVKNENQEASNDIVVDIKGAVKKEGVYKTSSNKRVIDVIKQAGGLKKDANTNYINLSARLKDEMVIWVYTNSEIKKLKLENNSANYMIKSCNCPVVDNTTCLPNKKDDSNKKTNGLVNINTASLDKILTIKGIGETKAKSIIEYRDKNGKFKTIEDIKNVTGIGESLYSKIKESITV